MMRRGKAHKDREKRKERAIVRIAQVLGDVAADGLLADPDGEIDDTLICDLESACVAWLKRRGAVDPAACYWDEATPKPQAPLPADVAKALARGALERVRGKKSR